jgi:predicted methyltransferase
VSTAIRELRHTLGQGDVKTAVSALATLANGLLFHAVGVQGRIPLRGQTYESVQTTAGMRRALGRAGFSVVEVIHEPFLVVTAIKLSE